MVDLALNEVMIYPDEALSSDESDILAVANVHSTRRTKKEMQVKECRARPLHVIDSQREAGMFLDNETTERLTQAALTLARRAGERIAEVYAGDYEVSLKEDNTPLTTADMIAHDLILAGLAELTPAFPVISEESDCIPTEERHAWEYCWIVDPLDGTREFLKRNGEFTVNIALVHKSQPMIGVIYAPILDVAYYANHGGGAFKQVGNAEPEAIHVRQAPADRLTVARSRCPNTGPNLRKFLDKLGQHDEIPMGSALKSCLVAEGAADVYARLGPTGEWDTAAAQCIVEEAGGHITDTQLNDLSYNARESMINPHFLVFGDSDVNWAAWLPADS